MAIAALILSILGLALCWWPYFGVLFSIAAIVLGAIGRKNPEKKGMATAALALGIVGAVLGGILTIVCGACAAASAAADAEAILDAYY